MGTRQTSVARNGNLVPSSSSSGGGVGAIGWFFLLLGIGFLLFFLSGVSIQVQTNEAAILGLQTTVSWHPNWAVYGQIPQLFVEGSDSSAQPMANYVSWFIELLFIGLTVAYDMVHAAGGYGSRVLAKIFFAFSWGIVLYNMFNDYNYGTLGSGIGGHLTFAIVASGVVAFSGKIAAFFLERGLGLR